MGTDFPNNLFQSIDTIVSARIANLPYDQTIECDIIDNTKATDGEYTVKYQMAKFQAYSENTKFAIGDRVYVAVPKGDFTQDKIIISKKKLEKEVAISKLPFSNFAKKQFLEDNDEYNFFTINGSQRELVLSKSWYSSELQAGYTCLGIKFAISCAIDDIIKDTSGNYSIEVEILGFDQTTTPMRGPQLMNGVARRYTFSTSDMIGANPYNTVGYINQTKLFDIKNLVVSGIKIYFVQNGAIIGENHGVINNARIRLTNISLYFGYSINEFQDSRQLFLYSEDGLQYNAEYNIKTLCARILDLNEDNTISEPTDLTNYTTYWGHYDQNSSENHGSDLGWAQGFVYDDIHTQELRREVELSELRSLMSETYLLSILNNANRKIYTSNILKFDNILYFEGSEIVDLLTGFQVNVAEEGYNGVYNIYGQDYLAIDPTATAIPHYFILNYYSTSGADKGLQAGDKITWSIPQSRSMIKQSIFDESTGIRQTINNGYYVYEKELTNNDIVNNVYRIPYFIESYYSSNNTNNTVSFTLIRDNNSYNVSKELLFGSAGSQGNEYNIIIYFTKDSEICEAITATPNGIYNINIDVYNYNNEKLDYQASDFNCSIIGKDTEDIDYYTTRNNSIDLITSDGIPR